MEDIDDIRNRFFWIWCPAIVLLFQSSMYSSHAMDMTKKQRGIVVCVSCTKFHIIQKQFPLSSVMFLRGGKNGIELPCHLPWEDAPLSRRRQFSFRLLGSLSISWFL